MDSLWRWNCMPLWLGRWIPTVYLCGTKVQYIIYSHKRWRHHYCNVQWIYVRSIPICFEIILNDYTSQQINECIWKVFCARISAVIVYPNTTIWSYGTYISSIATAVSCYSGKWRIGRRTTFFRNGSDWTYYIITMNDILKRRYFYLYCITEYFKSQCLATVYIIR